MTDHIKIKPTGWSYKERDTQVPLSEEAQNSGWSPCSQFPTEIHLELMVAGKIPHPYVGRNEHGVQWVSKKEWLFRSEINLAQEVDLGSRNTFMLEFEGLDTFATIYLNGKIILQAENQFLPRYVGWTGSVVSSL